PVIIFVLSAIYLAIIPRLGYVVSTFIYTSASMAVLGVRRITTIAAISVGASAVIFILFAYVLGVPLPRFPFSL
ncbi:MAG: tripartite tricarboxylate transporter TctB family protein, partial [Acetomicrobium sp.]